MGRWRALALVAIVFAFMCAASWQKWASVLIDGGREMNLPLRLLQGELIYAEAYYLYGPLAPYLNALLYKAFGADLNTLYLAGIVASLLVLLLVFHLGTQFMGSREAALATLAVLALCVFKQAGNYIFPYTFSALYGTLLGLAALSAQVSCVGKPSRSCLIISGALTGLALICKLEFGLAATASALALVLSARREDKAEIALGSLLPALAIPALTYGALAAKMPSDALFKDTYLLPTHIPAELAYFNKLKLGLNDPSRTVRELLSAAAMLGLSAGLIGLASIGAARSEHQVKPLLRPIRWLTGASSCVLLINALVFGTRWDVSPLRALPLLCVGTIGYSIRDRRRESQKRRAILVLGVYSLAVLARVITRVPSGGAYGSYLLPAPLVLFTYLATTAYTGLLAALPEVERRARRIVLMLFTLGLAATIAVLAYRYQRYDHFKLQTGRGTLCVPAYVGPAFSRALEFIAQNTRPKDYILAVPEGSSLNFLSGRPAPLRYEILTPGFLDSEAERHAIEQLSQRKVKLIFLLNRPTTEFGATAFGRDYYCALMRWIESNYDLVAVFGEGASAESEIGDKSFFIKCYRLKPAKG